MPIVTESAEASTPEVNSDELQDRSDQALGTALRNLMEWAAATPTSQRGLGETATILLQEARRALPRTECYLAIQREGSNNVFEIFSGAGPWAESMVGHRFPVAGTLVGRAIRGAGAVEVQDLRGRSAVAGIHLSAGFHSGRLVPMPGISSLADGRSGMCLLAFWRREIGAFSESERSLIDTFSRLAAMSLMGVDDRYATGVVTARLRDSVELALELGHTLDANRVITALLRRATESLDADRASLMTIDGDDVVIEGAYDRAGEAFAPGSHFRVVPKFKRILASKRASFDSYPPGEFDVELRKRVAGLRHTVTVPLLAAGITEAVLAVSRREEHPFLERDVATLEEFGSIAVLALRNARLYAEAQRARELERQHAERMAALEEVKSQFLNLASHELRGPLAVLRGYVSMLHDESLGLSDLVRITPLLTVKLDQMNMLVNEMLETARLEDDRINLKLTEVDLREIVDHALDSLDPLLQPGQLVRRWRRGERFNVIADPGRLETIVLNLVDNAIKYSPPGSPIRCSLRRSRTAAHLTVTDEGFGIARTDMPVLFTRFGRLVTKDNSHIAGTGLGLYLSRELARLQGGDITVRSRLHQGSTFVLRLPKSAQNAPAERG